MAQQPESPSPLLTQQDFMSPPLSRVSSPPHSNLKLFSIVSPPTPSTAAASSSNYPTLTPTIASSSYVPPMDGSQPLFAPDALLDSVSMTNGSSSEEVDPQILEALKSKDRLYVLKLGELMEGLLNDRMPRVELTPATSYQRLLVRRCCAYYKLAPEADPITKTISVLVTAESRIPPVRIRELVPAEASIQPAFKIMRRDHQGRRSKTQSQTGSVAGEDADLSDVEPSEAGSLGGRSNATGGSSSKKRMTIEEREAAYNEARSRIFMGFEEKDKEKDMNSSTLSVSGSAASSNGGGSSSTEDLDDSASTAATESEWSGPISRDKEIRRGGSLGLSAPSSSRSLRSSAPAYLGNGSGSSRNSRAPSPSFTYPSLYEPNNPSGPFDQPQMGAQMPPPGYPPPHYVYPYPPPSQSPGQPYVAYPYYPHYPPPQNAVPHPNQPNQPVGEVYPPQPMGYGTPYGWAPPPNAPPVNMQHPHHPQMPPPPRQMSNPNFPNPQAPAYPQHYVAVPAPFPGYPAPGYYPPPQPGQPMPPQPPPPMTAPSMSQPVSFTDSPRMMTLNGFSPARNHSTGNLPTGNMTSPTRPPLRNPAHQSPSGTIKRGGAVQQARPSWSYGPGIGLTTYGGGPNNGGDVVGPRLSSRKTSSGSSGNRTGDDVASNASSSTTSSSSRRTYTSTSSTHPLPARPDWAVGLKPQPTLHPTHNRHHGTMSPRTGGIQLQGMSPHQSPPQQLPPTSLHPTDFPPLSSAPEKRIATVGAWTNSNSTRSILILNGNGSSSMEDGDRGFERPPKGAGELFNPKLVRRPNGNVGKGGPTSQGEKVQQQQQNSTASLVNQVAAISVEDGSVGGSVGGTDGPAMILMNESVALSS